MSWVDTHKHSDIEKKIDPPKLCLFPSHISFLLILLTCRMDPALGADGKLKPASELNFFESETDTVPISKGAGNVMSRLNVAPVCPRRGVRPLLDLKLAHRRRSTSPQGIRRRTAWRLMSSKSTTSFLVKISIHVTHLNGGLVAVHSSQIFTALFVTYFRFQVHIQHLILIRLFLIKFIRFSSGR
jgi:hypothetical protein